MTMSAKTILMLCCAVKNKSALISAKALPYRMVIIVLKMKSKASGLSILQFPKGVKFGDETAYIVIGIAGIGNEHLTILNNIATMLDESENAVDILKKAKTPQEIYDLFVK